MTWHNNRERGCTPGNRLSRPSLMAVRLGYFLLARWPHVGQADHPYARCSMRAYTHRQNCGKHLQQLLAHCARREGTYAFGLPSRFFFLWHRRWYFDSQPRTMPKPSFENNRTAGEVVVTDDLELLLAVMPPRIRRAVEQHGTESLLEVVLDLGRLPEARYPDQAYALDDGPVTAEDLSYVVERVGQFGEDNRAGI